MKPEDFIYTVEQCEGATYEYFINKYHPKAFLLEDAMPLDTYTVHLDDEHLWCDCPGFRVQVRKPKDQHKHILLIDMYQEMDEGSRKGATFRMNKKGEVWKHSGQKEWHEHLSVQAIVALDDLIEKSSQWKLQ